MKKTLTLIAALSMTAMLTKAETTEVNTADLSTDQAYLESKAALLPAPATPATDAEKDANYWAQAVGSRVKVTGYAQAGYSALFKEGDGTASTNTNTFDMKRVILMVGVDITKDFYAFFMHDFKSGQMQEYYMEYRPSKAMNFRLGQSKKELSMENPMSPTVLESLGPVSPMAQSVFDLCGTRYGNGSGREMGLMMYGDLFNNKLRYVVEVLNGYKVNEKDNNNQKDIVAKLEYKPVPNFRFSVSGQKGYADDALGRHMRSDRYAVGAEWKSKKTGTDYNLNRCTTVRAEALGGRDGSSHSFGAYVSAAIPVVKRLDVVSMIDYYNSQTVKVSETVYGIAENNPEMMAKNYLKEIEGAKRADFVANGDGSYYFRKAIADTKQTNLMAGLQYWIHKKCRLQAQYVYTWKSKSVMNDYNTSAILTQVQVAF